MSRPDDRDAALEAELAALVPAAPPPELRRRVDSALAASPPVHPARRFWLAERLVWAAGGAIAASLVFLLRAAPVAVTTTAVDPAAVAAVDPPIDVTEEAVAWADAGVQFLDDQTPARILRRVAVERHRPAEGFEYHVPREDVILVPVALR